MRVYFLIVLILICVGTGFGQNAPTVKQIGKAMQAENLRGSINNVSCGKKVLIVAGTIINRNFEQDETTIGSFVLRENNGKKSTINLDIERLKLLGDDSPIIVNSLVANGRKVKVWYSQCSGAAKVFNFADRIFAF